MKITIEMLEGKGACEEARADFQRVFGNEVALTEENIDRALDHGFQRYYGWLSYNFLIGQNYRQFLEKATEIMHQSVTIGCTGCREELRLFVEAYKRQENDK